MTNEKLQETIETIILTAYLMGKGDKVSEDIGNSTKEQNETFSKKWAKTRAEIIMVFIKGQNI